MHRLAPWWTWTGAPSALLGIVLAGHIAFGLVRFPFGAVGKRAQSIGEWNRLGAAGWHFRLADDETRRVVQWLSENVRSDQIVLIDGESDGPMQLLAPVLFPALPVRVAAPRTGELASRPVFDGRAPWLSVPLGTQPVVVATVSSLRIEYR